MTASQALLATQDGVRPSFAEWLGAVRTEALERGIKPETIELALESVEEPLQVVIASDRTQAEKVLPLETYLSQRLTPTAIRTAREMFAKYRPLLDRISEKYGVSPEMIIAVWGSESNFGRFSGVRPTIAALATLAYDQRRPALFRKELFSALEILDHGDIELSQMRGSWAGAMGQPQFMPSSYLAYAEDFDGDGKRDIWGSQADIFASIANFLKGYGWITGKPWGREVMVTPQAADRVAEVPRRAGTCQATRNMTVALPLEKWQELGLRLPDGGALPVADQNASLVQGASRQFLVYENYDALLSYNCAHSYALTVALLSDRVATP